MRDKEFTCPKCKSHCFGSFQLYDGECAAPSIDPVPTAKTTTKLITTHKMCHGYYAGQPCTFSCTDEEWLLYTVEVGPELPDEGYIGVTNG